MAHPAVISALLLLLPLAYESASDKNTFKDLFTLRDDCTRLIHRQIDSEMTTSLIFAAMAANFDRNSIARKGAAKFFSENSKKEREHAQNLIDYLNKRGGKLEKFNFEMPEKYEWNNILEALNDARLLETQISREFQNLYDVASESCKDHHLMDFVEKHFFGEQVELMHELRRHIAVLIGMDTPMGEFLFDQQLLREQTHP